MGFGEDRGILAGEEGRERLIIVRYDNLMSEEVHVFGYCGVNFLLIPHF